MKKQNEQRLEPKLRFKGFTNDWEQRKLGEHLEKVRSYPISRSQETQNITNTKYIHYGDIHVNIAEYINQNTKLPYIIENEKYESLKIGDLIFADASEDKDGIAKASFISKDKYDFNIVGGTHTIATRPNQSIVQSEFIYFFSKTNRFRKYAMKMATGTKIYGITYSNLAKMAIASPLNTEEQKKIIKMISNIEALVTLHKRKLKIIDETIHELREQLFSTKYIAGKKVKSEKMKLNDFLEEVIEHSNKENQYPLLSSTNNGIETRSGRVSGSSNIGYKVLRKNQLVLSPQNLWLGNININRDFEVGIVSPSYKVFDIKNIKIIYLENILKTERMKYNFDKISIQGASVVRRNLDMKEFLNLEVRVTQKNEQEKLVKTFVQLRNIKFSLRSKIKILEKLKILYLDKMFI